MPICVALDGMPGVGKTTILSWLQQNHDVMVITEPEEAFLHLLTTDEYTKETGLVSAKQMEIQLTVMIATRQIYNKKEREAENKKIIILERDMESIKAIFTRKLDEENKLTTNSKHILKYVGELINNTIPYIFRPTATIILAPDIEVINSRLRKRQKQGDELYDRKDLHKFRDLYNRYHIESKKTSIVLRGELEPRNTAEKIMKIIEKLNNHRSGEVIKEEMTMNKI